MKSLSFFCPIVPAVLMLFMCNCLFGQDSFSAYTSTKSVSNVWTIVESNTVNIYVVEGSDSALVIDAGYGKGDLKGYIQTLTMLPLIMVNTHGHGDHTGDDHQFEKVYAHPEDMEQIEAIIKRTAGDKDGKTTLVPITEGYVFDLGGRKLEVIEVPGHTHGSICLIDAQNKILFAGDHINAVVWLFLKGCYPLEVYLNSLEKIEKRINDYNIIMPGHNALLDKTFITEHIACVKSILDGTCVPVPYNYSAMTKGAMLCKYKTSEVAYDPENLFVQPTKKN
jgi:hydroxyacylglutathione hydrolase